MRVISTAGSGNDPHLQQSNFVSLENPPAASATLSPLLLARLSQHGYKNILKLPQSNVDQGFSHVTQPVTHRQGPGCPQGRPERLPMSPQASLDFSHLHWTPPTPAPSWHSRQSCNQAHGAFPWLTAALNCLPPQRKAHFHTFLNRRVQYHLAQSGVPQAQRACKGPHGRDRGTAASAPPPFPCPPLHRLQPWPRRAPTGRGGEGGKRTEPTGSCHWDANGAAAACAPSPSASPPHSGPAHRRTRGTPSGKKGFCYNFFLSPAYSVSAAVPCWLCAGPAQLYSCMWHAGAPGRY